MEKTTQSLTTDSKPVKQFTSLSMSRAKKLAQELNNFLDNNRLIMNIAGKKYVPVEGWEFLGTQLSLTQIITSCEPVPTEGKEIKYKAEVEIINQNGTVVSRGFAWCSDQEKKKKGFEEYAVASMAQTRAIGKAYRNILSWIVKMGGYEATPYEEVDKERMETDLSKAKQQVHKALLEAGYTESEQMVGFIEKTISKVTLDTIDDAMNILTELEKDED